MNEIIGVFTPVGYSVEEGRIEGPIVQLRGLNFRPTIRRAIPRDTLFIAGQESKAAKRATVARKHHFISTDRSMEKMKPPVRWCPGVHGTRSSYALAHLPPGRGLAVDTNITFAI